MFLLIIWTTHLLGWTNQKIITINYQHHFGIPEIVLSLGNPPQSISLSIDFTSDYTFITSENYTPGQSTTKKLIKTSTLIKKQNYFSDIINISQYQETALLQDHYYDYKIPNFTFNFHDRSWYSDSELSLFTLETLGLTYKFEDPANSIVHAWHANNIIDNLQIGFSKSAGRWYFGGIDQTVVFDKYPTTIKVDKTHSTWGTQFNSFIIFNSTNYTEYSDYSVQSYAIFSNTDYRILAPMTFMTYINNTIFKPYIESKVCEYKKQFVYTRFICSFEVWDHFPETMGIVLDGHVIVFEKKELMLDVFGRSVFLIQHNVNLGENWLIGNTVWNRFDILFDYENAEMVWYSESEIKKISWNGDVKNNVAMKFGLVVVGVWGGVGSVLLMVARLRKFGM